MDIFRFVCRHLSDCLFKLFEKWDIFYLITTKDCSQLKSIMGNVGNHSRVKGQDRFLSVWPGMWQLGWAANHRPGFTGRKQMRVEQTGRGSGTSCCRQKEKGQRSISRMRAHTHAHTKPPDWTITKLTFDLTSSLLGTKVNYFLHTNMLTC